MFIMALNESMEHQVDCWHFGFEQKAQENIKVLVAKPIHAETNISKSHFEQNNFLRLAKGDRFQRLPGWLCQKGDQFLDDPIQKKQGWKNGLKLYLVILFIFLH